MSFLNEFYDIRLVDISNVPKEWVTKSFMISNVCREIKGKPAMNVVSVWNSSLVHFNYFMDTNGCFYDDGENFITDNTDEFLEYILDVTYTYHPKPSEYTYKLLKDAGWYEGRKEDITEILEYCKDNGTELTEIQKK